MFALSRGEFVLVVFIFALVWGSGVLPRLGERFGARLATRSATRRGGERKEPLNGG